jgi:hypothetical protein
MIPTLACSLLLICGADPLAKLPTDWHGNWSGKLALGSGPQAKTVTMSLAIQPLADGKQTWAITYEGQATRQYELVPTANANHFEIDEKNGIRLKARLSADGRTLTTFFRVGEQYLHTKYTRNGNTITYDLTTFSTKNSLKTKPNGTDIDVEAFEQTSAQFAELKRE